MNKALMEAVSNRVPARTLKEVLLKTAEVIPDLDIEGSVPQPTNADEQSDAKVEIVNEDGKNINEGSIESPATENSSRLSSDSDNIPVLMSESINALSNLVRALTKDKYPNRGEKHSMNKTAFIRGYMSSTMDKKAYTTTGSSEGVKGVEKPKLTPPASNGVPSYQDGNTALQTGADFASVPKERGYKQNNVTTYKPPPLKKAKPVATYKAPPVKKRKTDYRPPVANGLTVPRTDTADYKAWQAQKDKEYKNSIWNNVPEFMQPSSFKPQTKQDYYKAMQEMTRKTNVNKQNEGSFYQDTGWDALHPATIKRIQDQTAADVAELERTRPARERQKRYDEAVARNKIRHNNGMSPLPLPSIEAPIAPPVRPEGPVTEEQRRQYYADQEAYDTAKHNEWVAKQSPDLQAVLKGEQSPEEKRRIAYNKRIDDQMLAPSSRTREPATEEAPRQVVGGTVMPTGTYAPRSTTYNSDGTTASTGTIAGQDAKDYYAKRKAETGQLTPKEQIASNETKAVPIQQRFANMQDTLNNADSESRSRMLNALENGIYSGLTPEEKKAVSSVRIPGNKNSYRNAKMLAKRYNRGDTNTDYLAMKVKHSRNNRRVAKKEDEQGTKGA